MERGPQSPQTFSRWSGVLSLHRPSPGGAGSSVSTDLLRVERGPQSPQTFSRWSGVLCLQRPSPGGAGSSVSTDLLQVERGPQSPQTFSRWSGVLSLHRPSPGGAGSSVSTDLLHVERGLPLFRFPCGFHFRAWCTTLDVGFRRVWPSKSHFLLLIWGSACVSFVILSCHLMCSRLSGIS